jgi:sulfate adenylyltransferase subunit 1 (EFTu-like GTPase family)
VDEAFAPQSITLELNDDIDISRGDMVVRVNNHPLVSQDIEAMICWLGNTPATIGSKYALQHTTKNARVIIKAITYNIDIHTLQRVENQQNLQTNDLARVTLRITAPIFYDPYRKNRVTGSFILIEEGSNNTVAAGMII